MEEPKSTPSRDRFPVGKASIATAIVLCGIGLVAMGMNLHHVMRIGLCAIAGGILWATTFRFPGLTQFYKKIIRLVVLALLFPSLIWLPGYLHPLPPPKIPIEENICLYEPYGEGWEQGEGTINFCETTRLYVSHGKRRFTPGIQLKGSSAILDRITFVLKIPKNVPVEYKAPWVLNFQRPEYAEYVLTLDSRNAVTSSIGKHVPEPIWMTFSESTAYGIGYAVSGGTGDGQAFNITDRAFVVDAR